MPVIKLRALTMTPGPRSRTIGENSGQWFREEHLLPALRASAPNGVVTVDLDGTYGCSSSFLDEAFGGLVKRDGMNPEEVRRRVKVISEEMPHYTHEVVMALEEAEAMPAL